MPFDLRERAGIRVCEAMARRGVLTRPVGNVIVLMPPYCTTAKQLQKMVSALAEGVVSVAIANNRSQRGLFRMFFRLALPPQEASTSQIR